MSADLVIVGVDPSLTSTGVAGPGWVDRIRSVGRKADTLAQRRDRLHRLADNVVARVGAPDLVVIEAPALGSKVGSMHDRSGLWWLVVDQLHDAGIAVVEVAPAARARYATGRGNSPKDEVLAAAIRRYPDVDVTGNDIADAVILRAMACDRYGQALAEVPQAHREALVKVAWPDLSHI